MYTFIGIIILIISFILFITVMILIIISSSSYEESLCGLYTTAAVLREGENVFPKFIGLIPL